MEHPPMWTTENRATYNRDWLRYPSDLTDAEWSHVEPLIPPAKRGGGKRRVDMTLRLDNARALPTAAAAATRDLCGVRDSTDRNGRNSN